MIRTIDDYRNPKTLPVSKREGSDTDEDGFTLATAGHLKLKLQALNDVLLRTPLEQHTRLQLEDIVKHTASLTYISGSEEVYLLVHNLSWPDLIPDIFIKAYSEALQSRHFTNVFKRMKWERRYVSTPTFSDIRPLLPQLDAVCGTRLHALFQKADERVKPFPFLRLPTELRLQVYDHVIPGFTFVPVIPSLYPDRIVRPSRSLAVMSVCKAMHDEVAEHFYNKRTLLIGALVRGRVMWCRSAGSPDEYVKRITSIDPAIRCRFKRLEIHILDQRAPFIPAKKLMLPDEAWLRQFCASLPSLESITISYQKAKRPLPEGVRTIGTPRGAWRPVSDRWDPDAQECVPRRETLEWLRLQLPLEGPRILWDLTHFRHRVENAEQMRREIYAERMMRELIERDGCLELGRSVITIREDKQKWLEIKPVILQAVKKT